MKRLPLQLRWAAPAAAAVAFAALTVAAFVAQPTTAAVADAPKTPSRDWPMFGGDLSRNLVDLVEKGVPTAWSVKKGAEKNIKWSADLGSKAYGGPIVAGGKIFVGTNNNRPANKDVRGDKGVLMCLNEA